jgi:hypothetical protein
MNRFSFAGNDSHSQRKAISRADYAIATALAKVNMIDHVNDKCK